MELSKVNKVYNSLVLDKQALTAKQIAARFDVANPYDIVYTLRMEGFPINSVKHEDTKGRVTHKYTYGQAPREVIAAGYKALAMGLV